MQRILETKMVEANLSMCYGPEHESFLNDLHVDVPMKFDVKLFADGHPPDETTDMAFDVTLESVSNNDQYKSKLKTVLMYLRDKYPNVIKNINNIYVMDAGPASE